MYCCPGKCIPPDFHKYTVFDLSTGREVKDVIECDTDEGWVRVLCRNDKGKPIVTGYDLKSMVVHGKYSLVNHGIEHAV